MRVTFGDGVQERLLTHGGQQGEGAQVHPHLGVGVLLPGVILHDVEETSHQVEHAVLRMVLQIQTRRGRITVEGEEPAGVRGCWGALPGQPAAWPRSC